MGVTLIPVELPKLPYGAMTALLTAEAAAAFDDLTHERAGCAADRAGRRGLAERISDFAVLFGGRLHPGQPGADAGGAAGFGAVRDRWTLL